MTSQYIPWNMALAVFIGSLPIFAAIVWNLIDLKAMRAELRDLHSRIDALSARIDALAVKVGELAERVSKIEGKIEGHHVVLEN